MIIALYVLCFIVVLAFPLLIAAWLVYCTLILPGNDEYGRIKPSRAYTKRQIKKRKEKTNEM